MIHVSKAPPACKRAAFWKRLFDPIDRFWYENPKAFQYFTGFYFFVRSTGAFPVPAALLVALEKSRKFLDGFVHGLDIGMKLSVCMAFASSMGFPVPIVLRSGGGRYGVKPYRGFSTELTGWGRITRVRFGHKNPCLKEAKERRGRESNPRMEVLQTSALPLGYPAEKVPVTIADAGRKGTNGKRGRFSTKKAGGKKRWEPRWAKVRTGMTEGD